MQSLGLPGDTSLEIAVKYAFRLLEAPTSDPTSLANMMGLIREAKAANLLHKEKHTAQSALLYFKSGHVEEMLQNVKQYFQYTLDPKDKTGKTEGERLSLLRYFCQFKDDVTRVHASVKKLRGGSRKQPA